MIYCFDTETTDLPKDGLPNDHPTQPHLVQLGGILYDDDGFVRARVSLIVKPEGYVIGAKAASIHGITTAIALAVGLPIKVVMAVHYNLRHLADEIIAYNIEFDQRLMAIQEARYGLKPAKPNPAKQTCVMRHITPIVNLPPTERMKAAGFEKNKPPNLGEAIKHFFNEALPGAHDALIDAEACGRIYWHTRGIQTP